VRSNRRKSDRHILDESQSEATAAYNEFSMARERLGENAGLESERRTPVEPPENVPWIDPIHRLS
jgi:hypothetical protein